MDSKGRRKFDYGFKRQLLVQIETGQVPISNADRIYGVSPSKAFSELFS